MFNLTIYGLIQKHCSADLQIVAFATLYALFQYSRRASADFFPRRTNYQIHHLNPILSLSHDALWVSHDGHSKIHIASFDSHSRHHDLRGCECESVAPCVSSELGCKPATSPLGMLLLDIVRSGAHDNTTTSCSARGQSSSGCVRCLYGLGRTLLLLLHLLICVEQLSVFTLELIAHSLCNNGIPLAEQLSEISWTQKC